MVVLLWLITDEEDMGTNLKRRRRKREKMQMGLEDGVRERDFSFLLVLP